MVHRRLNNSIKGFYRHSDRVALLKISSRDVEICLLQVYAPTSESSDKELEQVYFQMEEGMKQCKSNGILLVLGISMQKLVLKRLSMLQEPGVRSYELERSHSSRMVL